MAQRREWSSFTYLRDNDDPPPHRTTQRDNTRRDIKPLEAERLGLEGQFSPVTAEAGALFTTAPIVVPIAGSDSKTPGETWTSPSGPILLSSELSTDAGPLRWVIFVTGNNYVSLGVLPHNRRRGVDLEASHPHWTPHVGLVNSPNISCCSLARTVFDNYWMEMSATDSTASFVVHHEDRDDCFEFDIPPTYERPIRLAICTYFGTVVTFADVEDGRLVKAAK
mmetsp:Transcript_63814/g.150986  ORF Transcript_63814/g.150986 Transcript_63814/m.150986 type:complete len:223 (-) Transcript_63814:55-723(-)